MKIVYLVSHLGDDGPVHAMREVVRGLRELGEDSVTMLTLSSPDKDVLLPQFRELGTGYVNIPLDKRHPLRGRRQLRAALRDGGYDVAGAACIRADTMLALSARGVPGMKAFTTIHNIPAEDLGFLFPGWRGRVFGWLHYQVIKRYGSRVVCVSNAIREHLQARIGGAPTRILNPVTRATHVTHDEPVAKTIIYAASLSNRKNATEAISFALGSPECRDYALDVYGRGPLEEALRATYADEPRVRWCGYTKDLASVLAHASVYVSASLSEGLPLTPQVALLAGCPCVLSDIAQHKEIVELSPYVFIYRSGDTADFSRAMQSALSVERAQVRADSSRLAELVSPLVIAKTLREFYLSEHK
jgi:glycosyltransferase involved in cell wall biosynthesis